MNHWRRLRILRGNKKYAAIDNWLFLFENTLPRSFRLGKCAPSNHHYIKMLNVLWGTDHKATAKSALREEDLAKCNAKARKNRTWDASQRKGVVSFSLSVDFHLYRLLGQREMAGMIAL